MSDEKPPEDLPSDADDWIRHFVENLEAEFLHIAKSTFLNHPTNEDFHNTLLFAIQRLLTNEGMSSESIRDVLSDSSFGWTEEKNKRRFDLIDRESSGEISYNEAQELEALTFQMRYAFKPMHDERIAEARRELENLKNEVGRSEK